MKLDGDAFRILLDKLGEAEEDAGAVYETMRMRLIRYFCWERSLHPEELADEVLDRVARKLREGETIRELPSYLTGVARVVAGEERTRLARRNAILAEAARAIPNRSTSERGADALASDAEPCFPRCLASLPPESRELLLRYYNGDGGDRVRNRKELAEQLGLEMNALRNRALRLRERLEQCIERCRKREQLSRMMDRHAGDSSSRDSGDTPPSPVPQSEERNRMISFLLDQLPEPEREPFRARLAADPQFFDAMQDLEYDLVDSYVRGTLDAGPAAALAELERVSSFWRERIGLARQLQARQTVRRKHRDYRIWSGVAAASLTALFAGYAWWQASGSEPRVKPGDAPAAIVATLVPGTLRGATSSLQTIQVPQGTELVRLDLEAEGLTLGAPVRATLRRESGPVLLFVPAVNVDEAGRLRLVVPAALLTPGSFELQVQRRDEPAYEYRFAAN